MRVSVTEARDVRVTVQYATLRNEHRLKHIHVKKRIVRQVGHLQELYRDARPTKLAIKSVNTRHDTQTSPLFLLGYLTASLQALITL
jgi:hypothetical protein